MTDITIPDAAMKAAVAAYRRAYFDGKSAKSSVEASVTAAAPHIAAQALRDAAQAWQINGWAESLPLAGSNPVIAMAQHGTDWLRVRADQIEADHG